MKNRKWLSVLLALNLVLLATVVFQQLRSTSQAESGVAPLLGSAEAKSAAVFGAGQEDNPIVNAARTVSPAVVGIGGTISLRTRQLNPFFEDFYYPFYTQPTQRQFEVPFLGSGVFIDDKGHLVTNVHVIEKVTQPFVTMSDGRKVKATLLDLDNRVDVALLKADLDKSPYAEMGDSDKLVPGQWAIAIGKPFGDEIPDPAPTVTVGVVSALHRNYKAGDIDRTKIYLDMIQTDAAINPGNSGGPLVDITGRIVGLNTFIVSRNGGSVGIGFAIPVNRVHSVVDEIIQHGRLRNYVMDFDVIDMTPRIARWLQLPTESEGAVVNVIRERRGAASKAGLEVGDVIVQADRQTIRDSNDLTSYFLSLTVGAEIQFTVLREGKRLSLKYRIEEYREQ